MEQLSGLDGLFIHAEMNGMPMHLSSFTVYNPATSPGGKVEYSDLRQLMRCVVENTPILRCRVSSLPFQLDQPYWVEVDNFELDAHLHYMALPRPGDWRSLCDTLADLHATPLSREKPLWEAWVIDGLDTIPGYPEGAFGFCLKVHHSVMDGRTGMAIFKNLHSLSPEGAPIAKELGENGKSSIQEEFARPPQWRAWGRCWSNNMRKSLGLAKTLSKTASRLRKIEKSKKKDGLRTIDTKCQTRFNAPISTLRSVDRMRVPFAEIQLIRKSIPGCTVNDVALSVIGGAMRKYLQSKGELPFTSLVATVPIDIRKPEDADKRGNSIGIMNVALRSDIRHPVERLQAVHEEASNAKKFTDIIGSEMVGEALDSFYSGLFSWVVKASVNSGLVFRFSPINHTIVTNVPGVPIPMYLGGAEIVDSFGLGPLMPNTGIFHTVSSTMGSLAISFSACKRMVPDPEFYRACLEEAYQELCDQALQNAGDLRSRSKADKSVAGKSRQQTARIGKSAGHARDEADPVENDSDVEVA